MNPAPSNGPNRAAALAQYRRRAGIYDLELALFEPIRRRAIETLALKPGETVLDVGCGTGLSLPLMRQAVGAKGRLIGIEQSPEMLSKAQERVSAKHWRNVQLVCSPVETAPLSGLADAALFHFTHDVLRRRSAVHHVLRHLQPGARVVACGLKWAAPWAWPVNLLVWPAALRSVTSLDGLRAPWSFLEEALGSLQVQSQMLGGVFLASGVMPVAPARRRMPVAPAR